ATAKAGANTKQVETLLPVLKLDWATLRDFRNEQAVLSVVSSIHDVYPSILTVKEHEEVVSEQFHLLDGLSRLHRRRLKAFAAHDRLVACQLFFFAWLCGQDAFAKRLEVLAQPIDSFALRLALLFEPVGLANDSVHHCVNR